MKTLNQLVLTLFILLTVNPSHGNEKNWEKNLPQDAREMLDSFPGRAISLDLVVGRAMQYSDSFKGVKSAFAGIETSLLDAEAPYDFSLNFGVERVVNKNEPVSAFSPNRIFQTEYSVSTAKLFPTGTLLTAEITNGSTLIGFQTVSSNSFFESVGSFKLTQSLLKDSFGSGSRKNRYAGEKLRDAAEQGFQESVEQWTSDLITLFYNAWLAQTQTKAAIANIKRRERLVNVTRIKLRRGTSERPDLLQVEAALLDSKTRFQSTEQNLQVL